MSTIARYINRLAELQEQLVEAEAKYQAALGRVTAIQQSDGVGQFMYVPAGGVPIQLAVPPEAYKTMLDDLTKASVNSAVSHIAGLWMAVGGLATEVNDYIAAAEAKAGVAAAEAAQPTATVGFADTGLQTMCDNTAVASVAGTQGQLPQIGGTVALPPRVRRIPGGG